MYFGGSRRLSDHQQDIEADAGRVSPRYVAHLQPDQELICNQVNEFTSKSFSNSFQIEADVMLVGQYPLHSVLQRNTQNIPNAKRI